VILDPHLRADLLEAREARQDALRAALGGSSGALLMLSANVPGPDKQRPGVARLLRAALAALDGSIGLVPLLRRRDRLGLFHLAASSATPAAAKAAAIALEAAQPWGRLLDLDVYAPDGHPVDRAGLGLAPRPCLVCREPARECIRLGRHSAAELQARVEALLRPWRPAPVPLEPHALAGLPAGFERAWPCYPEALEAGWSPERAALYLMAVLLQRPQDGAIPPGGALARAAADLERQLDRGLDPRPALAALDREYRGARLTLGGKADCMALGLALRAAASAQPEGAP